MADLTEKQEMLAALSELCEGDPVLMAKYITLFLDMLPQQIHNIEEASKHNDAAYHTLHILKSQVELMGMPDLVPQIQIALVDLRQPPLSATATQTLKNIKETLEAMRPRLTHILKLLAA